MDERGERFTFWHALLLAEGSAAAIALLMPITPPKLGDGAPLARVIWPEPSYLQEVAFFFMLTNALFVVLALAGWVWWRLSQAGPDGRS